MNMVKRNRKIAQPATDSRLEDWDDVEVSQTEINKMDAELDKMEAEGKIPPVAFDGDWGALHDEEAALNAMLAKLRAKREAGVKSLASQVAEALGGLTKAIDEAGYTAINIVKEATEDGGTEYRVNLSGKPLGSAPVKVPKGNTKAANGDLTPKQREAKLLQDKGKTRKQIAEEMGVNTSTVGVHLAEANKKLAAGAIL